MTNNAASSQTRTGFLQRAANRPLFSGLALVFGVIGILVAGYWAYSTYSRYSLSHAYDRLDLNQPYQLKTTNFTVYNISPATPTLQYVYAVNAPADQLLTKLSQDLKDRGYSVDYDPETIPGRLDATKPADHLHIYAQADKEDTTHPQGIDSLNPDAKTLGIMIFHEN